jgi:hypothetical protein
MVTVLLVILWAYHENQTATEQNKQRIQQEQEGRRKAVTQARYQAYVLCRSTGRTRKQCRTISDGIILPPMLTLDQLESQVAEIGEATVTRLFVNKNGKRGRIGPGGEIGKAGAKGDRGATGKTGNPGPQGNPGSKGEKGNTGSRGQRGATGPRGPAGQQGNPGAQGQPGPPGPAGPQGLPGTGCPDGNLAVVRTITIPSVGTVRILTCP